VPKRVGGSAPPQKPKTPARRKPASKKPLNPVTAPFKPGTQSFVERQREAGAVAAAQHKAKILGPPAPPGKPQVQPRQIAAQFGYVDPGNLFPGTGGKAPAPARNTQIPNLSAQVALARARQQRLLHGGLLDSVPAQHHHGAPVEPTGLQKERAASALVEPRFDYATPPPGVTLPQRSAALTATAKPTVRGKSVAGRSGLIYEGAPKSEPLVGGSLAKALDLGQNQSWATALGKVGHWADLGVGTLASGGLAGLGIGSSDILTGPVNSKMFVGTSDSLSRIARAGVGHNLPPIPVAWISKFPQGFSLEGVAGASTGKIPVSELGTGFGLTPDATKTLYKLAIGRGWKPIDLENLSSPDLYQKAYNDPPNMLTQIVQGIGRDAVLSGATVPGVLGLVKTAATGHPVEAAKQFEGALQGFLPVVGKHPFGQTLVHDPLFAIAGLHAGLKTAGEAGRLRYMGADRPDRIVPINGLVDERLHQPGHRPGEFATINRGPLSKNLVTAAGQTIRDFALAHGPHAGGVLPGGFRTPSAAYAAQAADMDRIIRHQQDYHAPGHFEAQVRYNEAYKAVKNEKNGGQRAAQLLAMHEAGGPAEAEMVARMYDDLAAQPGHYQAAQARAAQFWHEAAQATEHLSEKDNEFIQAHALIAEHTSQTKHDLELFGRVAMNFRRHSTLIRALAHHGDELAKEILVRRAAYQHMQEHGLPETSPAKAAKLTEIGRDVNRHTREEAKALATVQQRQEDHAAWAEMRKEIVAREPKMPKEPTPAEPPAAAEKAKPLSEYPVPGETAAEAKRRVAKAKAATPPLTDREVANLSPEMLRAYKAEQAAKAPEGAPPAAAPTGQKYPAAVGDQATQWRVMKKLKSEGGDGSWDVVAPDGSVHASFEKAPAAREFVRREPPPARAAKEEAPPPPPSTERRTRTVQRDHTFEAFGKTRKSATEYTWASKDAHGTVAFHKTKAAAAKRGGSNIEAVKKTEGKKVEESVEPEGYIVGRNPNQKRGEQWYAGRRHGKDDVHLVEDGGSTGFATRQEAIDAAYHHAEQQAGPKKPASGGAAEVAPGEVASESEVAARAKETGQVKAEVVGQFSNKADAVKALAAEIKTYNTGKAEADWAKGAVGVKGGKWVAEIHKPVKVTARAQKAQAVHVAADMPEGSAKVGGPYKTLRQANEALGEHSMGASEGGASSAAETGHAVVKVKDGYEVWEYDAMGGKPKKPTAAPHAEATPAAEVAAETTAKTPKPPKGSTPLAKHRIAKREWRAELKAHDAKEPPKPRGVARQQGKAAAHRTQIDQQTKRLDELTTAERDRLAAAGTRQGITDAYDSAVQEFAKRHLDSGGLAPARVAHAIKTSRIHNPFAAKNAAGVRVTSKTDPREHFESGNSLYSGQYVIDPALPLRENMSVQRLRASIGARQALSELHGSPVAKSDRQREVPQGNVFVSTTNARVIRETIQKIDKETPVDEASFYESETALRQKAYDAMKGVGQDIIKAGEEGELIPQGMYMRVLEWTQPETRSNWDRANRQYQRALIGIYPSTIVGNTLGTLPLPLIAGAGLKAAKWAIKAERDPTIAPASLRGRGAAGMLAADAHNIAGRFLDFNRGISVRGEDFSRRMAYYGKAGRYIEKRAKQLDMAAEDYARILSNRDVHATHNGELVLTAKDLQKQDHFLDEAIKFTGDLGRPTGKAAHSIGKVILFHNWIGHILKLALFTLPVLHPRRALLLNAMSEYGDEYRRKHGVWPSWMTQFFPLFDQSRLIGGKLVPGVVSGGTGQLGPIGSISGLGDALMQDQTIGQRASAVASPMVQPFINAIIQGERNYGARPGQSHSLLKQVAYDTAYAIPGLSKFHPRSGEVPSWPFFDWQKRQYYILDEHGKHIPIPGDQRPGGRPLGGFPGIISRVGGLPLEWSPTGGTPIGNENEKASVSQARNYVARIRAGHSG
jgi:hypothetical protein